jgi:two-component system phosphate regulon response regulator PhoB
MNTSVHGTDDIMGVFRYSMSMSDGYNILVVEDEPDIQDLICHHLKREGFTTLRAATGNEALNLIQEQHVDLILLDLMLPGKSGIEVLKTLRFSWSKTDLPVIIVSARTDESDIITGLELGADNYLPKPFSPKVLVANVKALLRRTSQAHLETQEPVSKQLQVGNLIMDTSRYEAFWDSEQLSLTASEFNLLYLLASSPGRVYTRNQIITEMRGSDYPVTERSIDVQIASLRRKMGKGGSSIKTVWGIGYSLQEPA